MPIHFSPTYLFSMDKMLLSDLITRVWFAIQFRKWVGFLKPISWMVDRYSFSLSCLRHYLIKDYLSYDDFIYKNT